MPLSHHLFRTANTLRTLAVRVVAPVRLGARVYAQRPDGQVLFVRHSYMPGWYAPGGAVDQRESTVESGLRELREETGLTPCGPVRFIGLHFAVWSGVSDHVAVLAVPVRGPARCDTWEIVESRFAPLDQPPTPLPRSMAEQLEMVRASLAQAPLERDLS